MRGRALINLDGTGAKFRTNLDKHESVCVECKLYHTLRVMGVEACAGVADDFIARQHAIRDDGSVDFQRRRRRRVRRGASAW